MSHVYPSGAIKTEKQLLIALLGKTIFSVHGLGPNSYLTTMENVRNLHSTNVSGMTFRRIVFTNPTGNESWKSTYCLSDFNIGHHHNCHYLFHDRTSAEAYLKFAKTNTHVNKDIISYY